MSKSILNMREYRGQTLMDVYVRCTANGGVLPRTLQVQIARVACEFLMFKCSNPPHPNTHEKKVVAEWIVKLLPEAGPMVSVASPFEFRGVRTVNPQQCHTVKVI